MSFFPSHRRLLTQLEAAKGSRGSSAGDGKPTALTKGPDGVVLYELHSRPEQEKFNESAKVKRKERWINVCDECTHKMRLYGLLDVLCFCSSEWNVRILDGNKQDKRRKVYVWVFVCLLWDACCHCQPCVACSVSVDGGIGEASS